MTKPLIVLFCLLSGCKSNGQESLDKTEVIMSYIESNFERTKMDMRLYEPLLPPEKRDSVGPSGRMRPDSLIQKLGPFFIYLNPIISDKPNNHMVMKLPEGFEFAQNVKQKEKGLRLNTDILIEKEELKIIVKTSDDFFEILESIKSKEGYGGLYGFGNLIYSKDDKRAYFEVYHFQSKLNTGTIAVYVKRSKDGTWKFESELISIS